MADDNIQYQTKTVQAIRGTEARSISKWEAQGWEIVDQTPGKLRTTLKFRKPAPKVPWLPIAALLGVGVVILAIVGFVSLFKGDDEPASTAAATSTPTPSDTPSETASETITDGPEKTPTEDIEAVITVKNSDEFAALLVGGECDKAVKTFSSDNAGRTIEFDGGIADMAPHGNADTRYDILITPGDKAGSATVGPYFKFEDVNSLDLNFTGKVPNRFGTGDLIHVVADIDHYRPSDCILFLEPVETSFRK